MFQFHGKTYKMLSKPEPNFIFDASNSRKKRDDDEVKNWEEQQINRKRRKKRRKRQKKKSSINSLKLYVIQFQLRLLCLFMARLDSFCEFIYKFIFFHFVFFCVCSDFRCCLRIYFIWIPRFRVDKIETSETDKETKQVTETTETEFLVTF